MWQEIWVFLLLNIIFANSLNFFSSCLQSWLEQDTSCPTCRLALSIHSLVPSNSQINEPTNLPTNRPRPNHFFHFDGTVYFFLLKLVIKTSLLCTVQRFREMNSPFCTKLSLRQLTYIVLGLWICYYKGVICVFDNLYLIIKLLCCSINIKLKTSFVLFNCYFLSLNILVVSQLISCSN